MRDIRTWTNCAPAGAAGFLFLVSFALLMTSSALAQSSGPLILDHADSTILIQRPEETEYHLYGNVQFTQGDTKLQGDSAVWLQGSGQIQFDGHVLINQPGIFLGAHQVSYRKEVRSISALGNVVLDDTTESFALRSQRAVFDREKSVAKADSQPVVYWDFLLDSASQTVVEADTVWYLRNEKRGIGQGSVRVRKGGWFAEGDHGEIWPDSGRAILTGNPKASGLNGQISGDTLILFYKGRAVDRLVAIGHANGSYEDSTVLEGGQNLIKGRQAEFFLARDTLHAIRVIGEAVTDHIPNDPKGGRNHASGDSLWLKFDQGRLANVIIDGGAQGSYQTARGDGGADTVNYRAARIVFLPDSSRIDLFRDCHLNYATVQLDAGRVSYWTKTRNLIARPLLGTTDTSTVTQRPKLADGQQIVDGDTLTYNIDSQRGRIRGSATKFENAYYKGGDFKKYTEDVFFVTHGVYTTCDRDDPHFHFESRDMEVIRGDKVIARPVVMRIGELPVAILPYYIFPLRRGRHSGFLPLRFGNFERGQRFIGNAGYYWAASDYWDVQGALDFNENTGIVLRSVVNYAWRYHLSGYVSGSYARESNRTYKGQNRRTRWNLVADHRQDVSPTASLSASVNFVSDKSFYQNYSADPTDRRQRTITSQAHFDKRFSKSSFSVLLQSTENLDTDARTRLLPSVDFSMYSRPLIPADSGKKARWYNSGYLSYGSHLTNYENRSRKDSTSFDQRKYVTVTHQSSLSFPQRLFGHINISPNASLQEAWYYIFDTPIAREQGVPVDAFGRRLSGSLGVGSSTNLYGFLNPHLFGVSTIRHSMTPSVGYTFTPPVKSHDEMRSFTGAGGGSSSRSQSLSFSLNNALDAKLGEGEKERKISLLTASIQTSYNFEARQRRWSNLSASASTNLASRLQFSTSAVWDLYDPTTLKLQWSNPRLLSFDVSAAMTLSGNSSAFSAVTGIGSHRDSSITTGSSPFNLAFSHHYSESRGIRGNSVTNWTGVRVDFDPTKNWSVQYQQTINWSLHTITDQRFVVHRDLHCWEAEVTWVPGGANQGYYFRINVKDIPDIKIERSESGLRSPLSGYGGF